MAAAMLTGTAEPLVAAYDLAMLDLDGVVYVGEEAVPGAAKALERVREAGMHLAYVTNNASRPPELVAERLGGLGVPAEPADVVTSAQAAARMLEAELPPGAKVFVIGGEGLFRALEELGLVPVQSIDDDPQAVVSGYHPDLRWSTVIEGAILVKRGLPWVASNTDGTVPTAYGPGPGNGVLVGAVAGYAGRDPVVAGKPESPLVEETIRRVGGQRPLMVGDRLDTDIQGARAAGCDSLLVMTGVTDLAELVGAPPDQRPTYVAAGLDALLDAQPEVTWQDGTAVSGGWTARVEDGELLVGGDGSTDDWWRVVAVAGWAHQDASGSPAGLSRLGAANV